MKMIPFDYAVRNLGRSPRRTLAILVGNTLVVCLIIAAAAFVEGMRASLSVRDDSNNVILIATGSEESLERSEIPATTPGILSASVPGIQSAAGVSFISPEIVAALIMHESKDSQRDLRTIVRGITPGAFLVHDRVEIIEGRAPRAGTNELLIGSLAADKLNLPESSLTIGQSLFFDGVAWPIVGRFHAPNSVMNAELWTPLTDLQVAAKRDSISSVVLKLGSAEFADIDAFAKMRVDLELSAIRESTYYASLLEFYRPVKIMIWVTAVLIALTGILGGFNTLYSGFAIRAREFGMLQTLGYSRRAIAFSMIQEALLVTSVSVFIGILISKATLSGVTISHSMGVFELVLTTSVLAAGSTAGILLGLVGTMPPAWRCLRMPLPESLKSI